VQTYPGFASACIEGFVTGSYDAAAGRRFPPNRSEGEIYVVRIVDMFDVIVMGGTIIDGSGSPGFRADIGIEGPTITQI
jgi:hypothetical protein